MEGAGRWTCTNQTLSVRPAYMRPLTDPLTRGRAHIKRLSGFEPPTYPGSTGLFYQTELKSHNVVDVGWSRTNMDIDFFRLLDGCLSADLHIH
jgi:hypothetical protein